MSLYVCVRVCACVVSVRACVRVLGRVRGGLVLCSLILFTLVMCATVRVLTEVSEVCVYVCLDNGMISHPLWGWSSVASLHV